MSPDTVNPTYVRACDLFIYYSALFPEAGQHAAGTDAGAGDRSLLAEYVQLLCAAVASLEKRGAKPVAAAVAPLCRQLRPDFDLSLVGMESFRELVSTAEEDGLLTTQPSGGDLLLALSGEGARRPGPRLAAIEFRADDLQSSVQLYREFFREKLRCELPGPDSRQLIYGEASKILQSRSDNDPIELDALSRDAARRVCVRTGAAIQPAAFKVLYALFRAKVFEYEAGTQAYNPLIRKALVPVEEWDERFVANSLTVLPHERRGWPLNPAALASAFGVAPEIIERVIDSLE